MQKDEQAIFEWMTKVETITELLPARAQSQLLQAKLQSLMSEGIGQRSIEFITEFQRRATSPFFSYSDFILWVKVEQYLVYGATDVLQTKKNLTEIEEQLRSIHSTSYTPEGFGSLPRCISDGLLLQQIYLSGHEQLIVLCQQYLPIPGEQLFFGQKIPEIIMRREQAREKVVQQFLTKNSNGPQQAIELLVMVQRLARSRLRQQEEVQRIKLRFNSDRMNRESGYEIDDVQARAFLFDANTPYRPQQCDPVLADRLIAAAQKVTLFTTVRHLTATKNIASIFDGAMFGRRMLERKMIGFRATALQDADVQNGDGNAVCLGPNLIDPACMKPGTIEVTFNLDKLIEQDKIRKIPTVFFKQEDFGFIGKEFYQVDMGAQVLNFSRASELSDKRAHHINIVIRDALQNIKSYAQLPNYQFIAYDLQKIHSILTLNFFRFIDSLEDRQVVQEVYQQIEQLSEEQLSKFLKDLGQHMTDTCEFNFYGCYQVDFNLVAQIKDCDSGHVLKIPRLVAQLMCGEVAQLAIALEQFPTVLQSLRFTEYLISKVDHPGALQLLAQHKAILTNSNLPNNSVL